VLVIGAVALMGAFLANIYFEGRLGEFGLLAAFGFARERLARRVIAETTILVCAGWTSGMALSWLLFRAADHFYMRPRGLVLAPLDSLAVRYTLPTPLIVAVASLATVLLRLYRLDPIDIMERR
jgi:ABC-type antimicrobial peptide transport system permease subunit